MREISTNTGGMRMDARAEAMRLLRALAGPYPAGDKTKCAQDRAYRRLKTWSRNRVTDVWKGSLRASVSADEIKQLRELVREREADDARAVINEARDVIARLERCIRVQSEKLDRHASGTVLGLVRGPDRALD